MFSVKKKMPKKVIVTEDGDVARAMAQKSLQKLIAMKFTKKDKMTRTESKVKAISNEIRKELFMQAILEKNYLQIPLKKHYLAEIKYEPLRKFIAQEKENKAFICLVDEEIAIKQGALYRTELS